MQNVALQGFRRSRGKVNFISQWISDFLRSQFFHFFERGVKKYFSSKAVKTVSVLNRDFRNVLFIHPLNCFFNPGSDLFFCQLRLFCGRPTGLRHLLNLLLHFLHGRLRFPADATQGVRLFGEGLRLVGHQPGVILRTCHRLFHFVRCDGVL